MANIQGSFSPQINYNFIDYKIKNSEHHDLIPPMHLKNLSSDTLQITKIRFNGSLRTDFIVMILLFFYN